jgi:hypothetical protein
MSIALPGNIAIKTGKKLYSDAKKEDFAGAPDALAMLTRALRKPYDCDQAVESQVESGGLRRDPVM